LMSHLEVGSGPCVTQSVARAHSVKSPRGEKQPWRD
jgi:hypothetical protein